MPTRSSISNFISVCCAMTLCACVEAPVPSRNAQPMDRELALRACADGPVVKGIDLSSWQGTDVDWDAIAGSDVEFAFLRVSDGLNYPDRAFSRNWSEARRVGILRGAYQYFHPGQDATAQAEYLLEQMGTLDPNDLPPVIDVEATDGLSGSAIAGAVAEWIDVVETATGVKPIIYSGRYFWDDNVGSDAFADYPYWLPAYFSTYVGNCPYTAAPWDRWDFWQWTDSGTVPGVSGGVDSNVFNGDLDALMAMTVGGGKPICGDGKCTGNETNTSCAQDCPVCEPVPSQGRVIDDRDVCFEREPLLKSWRFESGGYDDTHTWTYATAEAAAENSARWQLKFETAGIYFVEVYTPAPMSQSASASYTVRHAGIDTVVTVDQTAANGWQSLGEHAFATGDDQWIYLGDNTGEPLSEYKKLVFDAVRLTPVESDTEWDSSDPPDTGDVEPTDSGASSDTTADSETSSARDTDDSAGTDDENTSDESSDSSSPQDTSDAVDQCAAEEDDSAIVTETPACRFAPLGTSTSPLWLAAIILRL